MYCTDMAVVGSGWLQKVVRQYRWQLAGLGILSARLGMMVKVYREKSNKNNGTDVKIN
jgi:hypothetical protein